MPTSGTEKVPEISEEAIRLGQEAADDLLQREIDAGNLLMATHPAVAQAILQAAYPAIRQSVLAEVKEGLLGEEAVAELQRQLSSEGWTLDGHSAYDAAKRQKAQEILSDALEQRFNTITPEEETITVEGSILGRPVRNSSGIGEYHGLFSPDACGEACAAAYTDCADYLRNLTASQEQGGTPNQSKSVQGLGNADKNQEGDEVEVRLTREEAEALAFRAELDIRWHTRSGPRISTPTSPVKSRVADKLRTALEEEGR